MHSIVKEELIKLRSRLQKKIETIEDQQNERPWEDFFRVQEEAAELLNSTKGEDRATPEFMKNLEALSKREKESKRKMKRASSKCYSRMLEQKCAYESALYDINNMLWLEDSRKMKG